MNPAPKPERPGPNAEAQAAARQEAETEKLAEYIQRVVDEAPPLSAAQRDRLAVLLGGGDPR
ncbi:MAG: hypothetical protein ACXWDJ_10635 [Aeromicrobium sp.]